MKTHLKNPHTFDMSNYYSGTTYMIGGRDFEREEKETAKPRVSDLKRLDSYKLDWSFLKKTEKNKNTNR